MRIAKWCLLAAAAACGVQTAAAQQPGYRYGYYYPPAYPQRAYYQNQYPANYPPVQQVQALHGVRGYYPAMGMPANAYYLPRQAVPPPSVTGVVQGGWDLNYYPPNPISPSAPAYNVPTYGMPVTDASPPRTGPVTTSWPAPAALNYPLPGGDMPPIPPRPPVPFHRKTNETGWVTGDYILGFGRSMRTSGPLATTGNPNNPSPGSVGQPGTAALFGGNAIDFGAFSGFRVNLGCYLDCNNRYSVELGAFWVTPNLETFNASGDSTGTPVLSRPFFTVANNLNKEAGLLVSFPGLFTGTLAIQAKSQLTGAEINGRMHGYWYERLHCDGLLGVRWMRLSESLDFQDQVNPIRNNQVKFLGANVNAPNFVREEDHFRTTNQFFGPQLGSRVAWEGRWFMVDAYSKVAIGVTEQRVGISGAATLVTPTGSTTTTGGVLALPSNIGQYSRTVFGIVPELGVNLGVDLTDHLRLRLGYSIILWDHVVRPTGQIDRRINNGQIPGSSIFGATTGPSSPFFRFNDEFYWMHAFNFGFEAHF